MTVAWLATAGRASAFPSSRCSRCWSRGLLAEAPSLLDSVLFLFSGLLVGVCRLSRWPACFLLASARVVPRLRELSLAPGGRLGWVLGLRSSFLVVLVSSVVFGILVYCAFVILTEISYLGRFCGIFRLKGCSARERFAECSF